MLYANSICHAEIVFFKLEKFSLFEKFFKKHDSSVHHSDVRFKQNDL